MGGPPTTQYALAGDVNIAYQVVGDGPIDLVFVYGLASNVEVFWEEPSVAAFFRRLAEFSRLIVIDRRGCGLSDRGGALTTPTIEERVEDLVAVLDAVGSTRASIFGISEGGGVAAMFAAMHPDRTASIVMYGTVNLRVRGLEHPWGWHIDGAALADVEEWARTWGTQEGAEGTVARLAPSMVGDAPFTAWIGRWMRQSLSRNEMRPVILNAFGYDLVDVFPAVRVPALVLFRRDEPIAGGVEYSRQLASLIPDARFVALDGIDHLPFVGDAESLAEEIEAFLVGGRARGVQRRLVTLLCIDIVESAERLGRLGDDGWREVLAAHDRDVRAHLARFGADEVKHAGAGMLAAFDGPARAIRCALGIVDGADRRGLTLRIGVHTGECEVLDDGAMGGIAVHVGARLVELARPGEILASSTVRDLVYGSGIRFADGRDVDLDGLAAHRTVFPVIRQGATPDAARLLATEHANVFRRDGEYWTVGHSGLVVTLRDSKGLRDLSRLLAEPGRELHALDLATEGPAPRSTARADARDADLRTGTGGEPIIDDTARAAYKRRITELEAAIDDADANGDGERTAAARQELDALVETLASAYGLGGRPRRMTDDVERARKAVTRRLRDAMTRIDRAHPALGRHLQAAVHTGVFCRYTPDRDIEWIVQAG